MLPPRSEILAEARNTKILTKNHLNSRIPSLIPRIVTLIPRVPTLIPHVPSLIPQDPIIPLIPYADFPFWLLQIAVV